MLQTLRFSAVVLVFAVAAPASKAGEKETLSELTTVATSASPEAVVVTISGSKAPDFTSFTMNDPFRVVVDWAGSKLGTVAPEKSFDRGLIRRISTKQFDSEAEKISRVTIELARETSYHVEADGKRVKVRFVPVPDPMPEPEVEPVVEQKKPEPAKVAAAEIPEGPLTEPDVAVPAELPPMVSKKPPVVVAAKVAPAPAQVAKNEPAKVMPVPSIAVPADTKDAKDSKAAPVAVVASKDVAPKQTAPVVVEQKPAAVIAKTDPVVEPKKSEPVVATAPVVVAKSEPIAEPKKSEPITVAKVEPAKIEQPAPIVQKTEDRRAPPVIEAPKTVVAARTEPKNERLASFPGVVPQQMVKNEPKEKVQPPTLNNTPASNPQRETSAQTARIASEMPQKTQRSSANVWQPPSVPVKEAAEPVKRNLPVVKLASAQGEPLKPSSTLPADPDEPGANEGKQPVKTPEGPREVVGASGSGSGSADGDAFDPGPRVMKYIGFQQMADVSRVFVRCDGKAKFREVKADGAFVLELVNTSINVKNNERPLDTTYFNSAVQKVQAVRSGENTRIEVKLRDAVPHKVTRIGNTIAIDFSRS